MLSIIIYGLILWGNCGRIEEILILQKKALRVVTKSGKSELCQSLYVQIEIQTVTNLYIYDLTCYAIKI